MTRNTLQNPRGSNEPKSQGSAQDHSAPELEGPPPVALKLMPAVTVALILCLALPVLAPTSVAPEAAGDHHFGWLFAALILGSLGTLFTALRNPRSLFAFTGPFLVFFSLSLLEQQNQTAAWHRCTPTVFGVGVDAMLMVTLALTLSGVKMRRWALAALCGAAAMALAPLPVKGTLTASLIAPILPSAGGTLSAASASLLFTHFCLFTVLATSLMSGTPPTRRNTTCAVVGVLWVSVSGFLGAEGWITPWGTWSALPHTLTRISALYLAVMSLWTSFADLEETSWSPQERAATELSIGLLILLVFFVLKWQGLHWSNTDENIYFYAAAATRDGVLPYRDYFFAHPPVRVLLPALVFHLFGFSVASAQLIPVVSASAAGVLLWRALRTHAGGAAGLLAMALFFAASGTLKASTDMTGINMTCALTLAAVLTATHRKAVWSGVFLALAAGTGMIAIWWLPVLCLIPFRTRRPDMVRFLGSFAACFLAIHAVGYAMGGAQYVEGVFTYHTLKAPKDPRYELLSLNPIALLHAIPNNFGVLLSGKPFRQFLYYHGDLVWLGCVVAPAFLVWIGFRHRSSRPDRRKGQTNAPPTTGAGMWALAMFCALLFMSALREQYSFYWVIFLPVIAAMAGCAMKIFFWLLQRSDNLSRGVFVLIFAMLLPTCAVREYGNRGWPSEAQNAGTLKSFHWADSSPDPILDSFTSSVFFKTYRVQGELTAAVHHYLWSKKRTFSTAPQIAALVRDQISEDQTITGASTAAPLIALLAQRRLANNYVDSNAKVFKTGMRSEAEFWRDSCEDNLAFILAAPRSFFAPDRIRRKEWVARDFVHARTFADPRLLHWRTFPIHTFQLRDGVPECAP